MDALELKQQEVGVDRQETDQHQEVKQAAEELLHKQHCSAGGLQAERARLLQLVFAEPRVPPTAQPRRELTRGQFGRLVACVRRRTLRRGRTAQTFAHIREELEGPVNLTRVVAQRLLHAHFNLLAEAFLARELAAECASLEPQQHSSERHHQRKGGKDHIHCVATLPATTLEPQHQRVQDEGRQVPEDERVDDAAHLVQEPAEEYDQQHECQVAHQRRHAIDQA